MQIRRKVWQSVGAEQFIERWKEDKRLQIFLKAVLMACLPITACLIYCSVRGTSIGQVYLPSSERNDELIYYKLVEGILHYGYPQGFFGFNENHALKLSFAAWSPVLVLPWVLWGLFFGWNLISPIICNITMITLAFVLFAVLVKPDWKQIGIITLLFFLYEPFVWYMLSGMPEMICMSILLVFYSLAVAWFRERKGYLLALLFVFAGLLTLMRPYMLLFLFLPAYFWIFCDQVSSKEMGLSFKIFAVRWKQILGSGLIIGVVLGAYAIINHFLAAEYFEPIYSLNWLTTFWEKGFLGGMWNFFGSLYYAVLEFWRYMLQGMRSGLAAGSIFCCYIAMMMILIYQTLRDAALWNRNRKERDSSLYRQLVIEAHLVFAFLGMLAAQLLMKNFYDGCKHLLSFLAVGIFVIGLMETKFYKKAVLMGVIFAYFFIHYSAGFEAYQPDFALEGIQIRMERWGSAVQEKLFIEGETRPGYDNVIIWVLTDETPQGTVYTGWQYLYSLPAGFGINCCTSDYVLENFDTLQSRYLCVAPGGLVETECIRMKYELIAENEYAVLYKRY